MCIAAKTRTRQILLLMAAIFVPPLIFANPVAAQALKITTWNLNWLTGRPTGDPALPDDVQGRTPDDFTRLRTYADKLDADIIAFQEVDGASVAARVFNPARYRIELIDQDVVQRVGIAVRRDIVVARNPDVVALEVPTGSRHSLRAGLDLTLTVPTISGAGTTSLRVLAVHLKSGCARAPLDRPQPASKLGQACTQLWQQTPVLADWARARAASGTAFIMLGDFNRQFDRPEPLGAALTAAAPLTRATAGFANPCWGGEGFIDHIFAGGPARSWLVPGSLSVLVYREQAARDRAHLSDHCPVSVRFTPH